jgi:hypothetical protein
MAIQHSHPLFIQEVQSTPVGYYPRSGTMGFSFSNIWSDIKTAATKELDKAKTQISSQFEQEKQKAIQSGLTQLQSTATQFVQDQASKLLNDPKKVAEVKAAAVPKIAEQVASAVQPVVQYAVDNPKKMALYIGLGALGIVALVVLAGRGAAVSVVKASNPRRKKKTTRRKSCK